MLLATPIAILTIVIFFGLSENVEIKKKKNMIFIEIYEYKYYSGFIPINYIFILQTYMESNYFFIIKLIIII